MKLTEQPQGTEELDYLHLSNANNAVRICHALNDRASAEIFYKISSSKVSAKNPVVSDITRAYFESARATHLTVQGSPGLALAFINRAIKASSISKSMRTTAILYCAQALTHIALADKVRIDRSKVILADLLVQANDSSDLQEDLLRTLVKLHSAEGTRLAKRQTLRYSRRLREHVVAVKFRHFLLNDATRMQDPEESKAGLRLPAYAIPEWILQAGCDTTRTEDELGNFADVSAQLDAIEIDIVGATEAKLEPRLRTSQYHIAECWAVAAEVLAEGTGSHCFRVGRLAGLIAGQIGWTASKCLALELACRLHDIGKLHMALGQSECLSLRSRDQFYVIREHSILGEQLLSGSSDQTLQLASIVAKSHHEWWNGCGFPHGLKGNSIAIEGRICAVADALITLLDPPAKHISWPIERAFDQVTCFSGVQLDPDLVRALGYVLGRAEFIPGFAHGPVGELVGRKKVVKSRRELFEVLEL